MVERIKLLSSGGSMVLAQHFIGRFEAIDCFACGALSFLGYRFVATGALPCAISNKAGLT